MHTWSRLLSLAAGLLLASQVAESAVTYTMINGPDRTAERYSAEVRYPGTPLADTIPDINPSAFVGKILVIKKNGQVSVETPAATNYQSVWVTAKFDSMGGSFPEYPFWTLPMSWGDYDQDGDVDLPMRMNTGTGFAEIPGFRDLLNWGNYHGTSWCDYDRDGDQDFVVLSYVYDPNYPRTLLLRNDGGTFTDVGDSLGIDIVGNGETPVWADFNGDGWPDLFAPYYSYVPPYQSFLYLNNRDGTFTDFSDSAGVSMRDLPQALKPEGADAVDWDNDGDLDLYVASRFFINDGFAHFTESHAAVGLPQEFDEGIAFVDYDNDGDFDLYKRSPSTAQLWQKNGGQFTNVTLQSGIGTSTWLWGDAWADYDNDSDLDIIQIVLEGEKWMGRLMMNNGNGTFTKDPGFSVNVNGALACADIDHDGDVDFAFNVFPPMTIYLNRLNKDMNYVGSALAVRVLDEQGRYVNHRATIQLRRTNPLDPLVLTRAVGAGSALAQNEYDVHFGLGLPGRVTRNPDLPEYNKNQTVNLTAIPSPGYKFVSWTGDATGKKNPLSVKMNANKTIRALFSKLPAANQAMFDGIQESSPAADQLVVATEAQSLDFRLTSVGPNPIRHGVLTAYCTLPVSDPVKLELFDISGRRVITNEWTGLKAGHNALTLNLESGLSPGCYLLQVSQGLHRQAGRVVVI